MYKTVQIELLWACVLWRLSVRSQGDEKKPGIQYDQKRMLAIKSEPV